MSRYIKGRAVKPRANLFGDDYPLIADLSVDDFEPVDTGLIWETGEPIMRTPDPIGFGRDEDW